MTTTSVPEIQHRTVLLDEAVDALDLEGERSNGIYIDGTFGRGGHSRLILSRLGTEARLIALTMADSERKRVMLFIAEGYKLLAERAELRDTSAK